MPANPLRQSSRLDKTAEQRADRIVEPMQLVLVVKDEPQIAEILEGYLRSSGYRIERAGDGAAAQTLFRAAHPA